MTATRWLRNRLVHLGLLLSALACSRAIMAQEARETGRSRAADSISLLRADSLLGAAWDARDVAAVLTLYDDSVLVQWPDDSLRGKSALGDHLRRLFGDPAYRAGGSVERREIAGSGDLAYAVGRLRYRRSARAAAGGVEEVQGAWVVVWRRKSEGWRIVAEMSAAGGVRRVQ